MEKYPQVLINVRTAKRVDLKADAGIQRVQAEVEARLAGAGRVALRASRYGNRSSESWWKPAKK
jgi:phosphoglucosamine mutase